ncbi:MAG: TIGR00730 family Rossman fold protein [Desulfobacterales bacterium]|jgi:hypothetical protein|nr:TIGR00730 family Rossman fold protein [Desulfobacterales bacterium]
MPKKPPRRSIFPTAAEDARHAGLKAEADYLLSTSYRLAFQDPDFLLKDELRPVRLQLELLKPELALQEKGVESAVVVFGSARFLDPEAAAARVEAARADLSRDEGNPDLQLKLKLAERTLKGSRYYAAARRLGNLIGRHSDNRRLVVMTGGGPGIMEAANRGAHEAGGLSIGMNIVLPHEQYPNPYVTPELNFQFHYFAIRKMHLLMRAKCLVAFPGGFGTLDELFETLTLIQTGKIRRIPVLLFDRGFWERVVDFQALVEAGTISPADLSLFSFVETAEEAWEIVRAESDRLTE